MDADKFEQARRYALHRLQRDLPAGLFYHSENHTVGDVVPAAERFALTEGIAGSDLFNLLTAATQKFEADQIGERRVVIDSLNQNLDVGRLPQTLGITLRSPKAFYDVGLDVIDDNRCAAGCVEHGFVVGEHPVVERQAQIAVGRRGVPALIGSLIH